MITTVILTAYFISLFFIIFWLLVFFDAGAKDRKKILKQFPSVSVCIPAYNEEKNIAETLKSVLKLDYPRDRIEIIVVNDGSTDSTRNIVENIMRNSKERIRLLSQKNKGKAAAMNNGLGIAKGEFFVSLDANSTVSKDALKKILPYFETEDTAAVLPLIDVKKKKTILQKLQYCEYILNFFYKRLMSNLNCIHVTPGPFSVYRKKSH